MRLACLLLFAVVRILTAAEIPDGGRNLLPDDWQAAAEFRGPRERAKAERVDFGEGRRGWRIAVPDDKAGPFQLQLTTVLTGEVKSGERLLLVCDARCVPGSSDDGTARLQAVVEIKEPPNYEKLGMDALTIGAEWQRVFLPFPANASSKPGLTHASFMPGGRRQTIEIANVRLLDYGPDFDLTKLPRPYIHYPGREPDAPWRRAALERIERIRTAPIEVEVVDAGGRPVPGAEVKAELERHAFAFGTAVKARLLQTDEAYRRIVDANFSALVLENDLKPFGWEGGAANDGKDFRREWTLGAMAWAKGRGLRVRGHYLCWGPWEPWSEALAGDPARIRERVFRHMDEVLAGAGGLVDEWDALNHPVGWESPRRTVDQAIGPDFYAEVFRRARTLTGRPLWINEDQVFRAGRQQDEFHDCIRDLAARGQAPDGIGNQAHFHSSHLPSPEEMLRISDRFAALVPNLEITEFDINTNGDEQLQADWLRDCLTMAYSHPAYSGFILWVFWEGAGWKPETALWRKDWSEKPNGAVWRQLVGDLWRTRTGGLTDAAGLCALRGHRGRYAITVRAGDRSFAGTWQTESGSSRLRVVLPD